jgi:hypothetical protein
MTFAGVIAGLTRRSIFFAALPDLHVKPRAMGSSLLPGIRTLPWRNEHLIQT